MIVCLILTTGLAARGSTLEIMEMLRLKVLVAAAAMVGMVMVASQANAQGCGGSCGGGGSAYSSVFGAGAGGFGHGGGNSFGYPGVSGCSSCGGVGRHGFGCANELRDRIDHARANSAKVAARNEAWPKPFNCASRQVYFSFWEPMIDRGFEKHCTLQAKHFDPETNQLNRFGSSTLAGIMQNVATQHRKVFIQRSTEAHVSEARTEAVRNAVATWYGNVPAPQIAISDQFPTTTPGGRIEAINRLLSEGTPAPIIPVASGTGSTSDLSQ